MKTKSVLWVKYTIYFYFHPQSRVFWVSVLIPSNKITMINYYLLYIVKVSSNPKILSINKWRFFINAPSTLSDLMECGFFPLCLEGKFGRFLILDLNINFFKTDCILKVKVDESYI